MIFAAAKKSSIPLFLIILVLIVYGGSIGFVIDNSDAIIAGISGVICAIIVHPYGKYMPRKTRAGLKAYAHILGYKEFIERVEIETLKRLTQQDPHLFERTLPYAVAMGLSTHWAKKFIDIQIVPPTWYVCQSHFRHGRFSTLHFMRSFGSTVSMFFNFLFIYTYNALFETGSRVIICSNLKVPVSTEPSTKNLRLRKAYRGYLY